MPPRLQHPVHRVATVEQIPHAIRAAISTRAAAAAVTASVTAAVASIAAACVSVDQRVGVPRAYLADA